MCFFPNLLPLCVTIVWKLIIFVSTSQKWIFFTNRIQLILFPRGGTSNPRTTYSRLQNASSVKKDQYLVSSKRLEPILRAT